MGDGQNGNRDFVYISKPPGGRRDGGECNDGDRQKQMDEEGSFRWAMSESERREQKTKRDVTEYFSSCVFHPEESSLPLGDYRYGGVITGAPSS